MTSSFSDFLLLKHNTYWWKSKILKTVTIFVHLVTHNLQYRVVLQVYLYRKTDGHIYVFPFFFFFSTMLFLYYCLFLRDKNNLKQIMAYYLSSLNYLEHFTFTVI